MKRYLLLAVISIALLAACTATTPATAPPTLAAPVSPSGAQAAATSLPARRPTSMSVQSVAPLNSLPQGTDGYPWWNDSVFYEIFVRSFYDSNGDGIGDLNGLNVKLDYLQDLGVTGLWLMPIHPAASYHGYDVKDYYSINPDYGTYVLVAPHEHREQVTGDFAPAEYLAM